MISDIEENWISEMCFIAQFSDYCHAVVKIFMVNEHWNDLKQLAILCAFSVREV